MGDGVRGRAHGENEGQPRGDGERQRRDFVIDPQISRHSEGDRQNQGDHGGIAYHFRENDGDQGDDDNEGGGIFYP